MRDFLEPDRVVVGDDGDWAGDAVVELYSPLGAPLVRTDIASAEMIKLAANAFLATKISFINEIANVSEVTGANVIEVARGIGLDDRIGPKFLQAGVGFGGSCFPKDVTALKQLAGNSGYHFQLLNAVIEVNELQKRRVMAQAARSTSARWWGKVALLGLAFKPQHRRHARGDLARAQRAPAGRGAKVSAYDPVAEEEARKLMPGLEFADDALERGDRRRRGRARDRVGRVQGARLRRGGHGDERQAHHRRAQRARPRGRLGGRADLRGHRAIVTGRTCRR